MYVSKLSRVAAIVLLGIANPLFAATYNFGGGGVPGLVGSTIINQAQGSIVNCASGAGNPSGCSTSNPTTPGLDPTNATFGAKGNVRGVGEWFGSQPQTTTGATITSNGTTLTVSSAVGFPTTGNFNIFVDTMSSSTTVEEMTVTAGQGTTSWTVTRGINGTSTSGSGTCATREEQ